MARTPSLDANTWDHERFVKRVKLPGLVALPRTGNPQLDQWVRLVSEHLEVHAGARGAPDTASATRADLKLLHKRVNLLRTSVKELQRSARSGGRLEDLDLSDADSLLDTLQGIDSDLTQLSDDTDQRIHSISRRLDDATLRVDVLEVWAAEVRSQLQQMDQQGVGGGGSLEDATVSEATEEYYPSGDSGVAWVHAKTRVTTGVVTGLRARRSMTVNTSGGGLAGIGISAREAEGTIESAVVVPADRVAFVPPTYVPSITDFPARDDAHMTVDGERVQMNRPLYVPQVVTQTLNVAEANVLAAGTRTVHVEFAGVDVGVQTQGEAFFVDTGRAIEAQFWADEGPALRARVWPSLPPVIDNGPAAGPAFRIGFQVAPLMQNEWDAAGVAAAGVGRVILRCVPVLLLLEPADRVEITSVRWMLFAA